MSGQPGTFEARETVMPAITSGPSRDEHLATWRDAAVAGALPGPGQDRWRHSGPAW